MTTARSPLDPVLVQAQNQSSIWTTLAKATKEVCWDDPCLDAHVLPAALLLEPIVRLATREQLPQTANASDRVECELQYRGALPEPGERLEFELCTDAPDSGVHSLRRFQLVCRARGPQDASSGGSPNQARMVLEVSGRILSGQAFAPVAPWQAPERAAARSQVTPGFTRKVRFTSQDLDALASGDPFACFGAGFERAASHTRTPALPGAQLVRITSVEVLDAAGGPWSLGLLRAHVAPDPAVGGGPSIATGAGNIAPSGLASGTGPSSGPRALARLYQAALQPLAFFVISSGATVERDGWRFVPLQGQRSRVWFTGEIGAGAALTYELLVESLEGGPSPKIIGHVKAWAGDTLVFEGERLGLALVPDWPLSSDRLLLADAAADDANPRGAAEIDGFRIGYRSLLAGALGRPSDAFREPGTFFETGERQMPRLPGPPYHFITRVTAVSGERLSMRPGAEATMEYDVPPDAWYFDENGQRTMPFCVLLEAALQPCGWLSVYVGCPINANENVFFRNLDGNTMTMTAEVLPESGTLRTHAKVTSVIHVSGVMLLSYKIECRLGETRVCQLNAMFGYFSKQALAMQGGLPTTDDERARLTAEPTLRVDLAARPERYFSGPLRLPGPMLLMIDRVTGYAPAGSGGAGSRLRAEKDVKPRDWFFRAHFYSDPVQPGSLGLEMMLQLLQFFVIHEDLAQHVEQPTFEPLALDRPVSWKFRGQVRPENKHIVTDVEILSVESRSDSVTVIANGSLWVDGVRCYEAKGIGTRVRRGPRVRPQPPRFEESVLDPAIDRWVTDHRPTYTVPVMPGMGMLDRLAAAALAHVRAAYPVLQGTPDWLVVGADDVRHPGWLVCDEPKRLRTEVNLLDARAVHRTEEVEAAATLTDITDDESPRRVSAGRIRLARRYARPPQAWPPLPDATLAPSPYQEGCMFWGPRLQLLRRLAVGAHGASLQLDAAGADAPIGTVHPVLLDGTLHAIYHDELERWSDKIQPGFMGVPVRLSARFFGPTPSQGLMRAEIRFVGFDGASAFPTFLIQIIDSNDRVWAMLRHVEMLVPMGHRRLRRDQRVPFLVERRFCKGAGLSEFFPDRTELDEIEVKRMDTLPGGVAYVYGLDKRKPLDHRLIAIKDHVGQRERVHPARVFVNPSLTEAHCEDLPLERFPVSVEQHEGRVVIRDAGPPKRESSARK